MTFYFTYTLLPILENDGFLNFFTALPNVTGLGLGYVSFDRLVTGDFLFAAFQLERVQAGRTEFSLQSNVLANFFGGEVFDLAPVNTVAVSEPEMLWSLSLVVFLLIAKGRKVRF